MYVSGLRRFCYNNIEVVDAVFESHLKLIAAHGVDMKKAIDYYHALNIAPVAGEGHKINGNEVQASNDVTIRPSEVNHAMISK